MLFHADQDDFYSDDCIWKCELCAVVNSRDESECRFCGLPRFNRCTCCRKPLVSMARFCKYCGEMSEYFQRAVHDPKEREYARRDARKEIARWKKRGISYFYSDELWNYEIQFREFGEVLG